MSITRNSEAKAPTPHTTERPCQPRSHSNTYGDSASGKPNPSRVFFGTFRVAVSPRSKTARLQLEARYLYLEGPLKVCSYAVRVTFAPASSSGPSIASGGSCQIRSR